MCISSLKSIAIDISWDMVFDRNHNPYNFPNSVTAFDAKYKNPVIYRWNIYDNNPGDKKLIYIGETEILTRRINGYINPGPTQQTNKRIKGLFDAHIGNKSKVCIEILRIDKFTFGDIEIGNSDLIDKHVRKTIEGILILFYAKKGWKVLNL